MAPERSWPFRPPSARSRPQVREVVTTPTSLTFVAILWRECEYECEYKHTCPPTSFEVHGFDISVLFGPSVGHRCTYPLPCYTVSALTRCWNCSAGLHRKSRRLAGPSYTFVFIPCVVGGGMPVLFGQSVRHRCTDRLL